MLSPGAFWDHDDNDDDIAVAADKCNFERC